MGRHAIFCVRDRLKRIGFERDGYQPVDGSYRCQRFVVLLVLQAYATKKPTGIWLGESLVVREAERLNS